MTNKPHIVVLTGAGISAESGIKTFRDAGGLWEGHQIEDVASPEGWQKNPAMVLDFYNQRRQQLAEVKPNVAHLILAEMEKNFRVSIITQNVDDLHERAGSNSVLHLHGELIKVRSTGNPNLITNIGYKTIQIGDNCEEGYQLRPHIVWFGEAVPMMDQAMKITRTADVFVVIGTSLEVYPAASLLHFVPMHKTTYIIDPNRHAEKKEDGVITISEPATTGMEKLKLILEEEWN